ncbi:DNA breaking-rejoining enzyme [Favolaschia claudopus]|uniref:DNA breaking-rejoining enzyme n=1 Tax=Favolaschia claudopus TaxID=2862362 RepID=A0AAV9Z1B5_9AGAR
MHRLALTKSADADHLRSVEFGPSVSSSRPQAARKSSGPRISAKPYNRLKPSPLRPPVLAKDRILSWRTPYSFHSLRSLSVSFSPDLISRWQTVLAASVERDTHGSYAAGLLRFNHFCDLHNIPETQRMPASEALLSIFVSSYGAGFVASGTVGTWLAGLQLWHAVNFAPWHGATLLSRTRKAWRDCARLGEILVSSISSFDPKRNVTRGCAKKRGTASNGHKFISFKVPWTKTRLALGDWLTSTETSDEVDAVAALEHHLVVNSSVPDSAPLFAYATRSGWSHLTRTDFITRCNQIWLDAGMAGLNGHGFRIGGTTHLLLHGVDPWVVMKQGRWSSAAFLVYWRNVEEILPLFIGDSLDTFKSLKESVSRLAKSI